MFGWLRRRKEPRSEAEAAFEEEFNEVMRKVDAASPPARAAVAYGVAFSWRMFVTSYPTAAQFQSEPRNVQMAFADKLTKLEEHLTSRGDATALGVGLTKMYLAPLVDHNAALANRMVARLEPLNREGYVLLNAGPTELPER